MTASAGKPLPTDPGQSNVRTPFRSTEARLRAGRFGLTLFLISLGALFAATLIAFLVLRIEAGETWPASLPSAPWILWISTGVLVCGSGTIQAAVTAQRRGRNRLALGFVGITGLLGVLFVALQAIAWIEWHESVALLWNESGVPRVAAGGFYVLTGIHAVHVVGGLVAVGILLLMAARVGASNVSPGMIHGCAIYWHFLDVVWIILLLAMVIAL